MADEHAQRVDLSEPAKYLDQRLGYGKLKGECAAGVQYVFHNAAKPLGLTGKWKQGMKVKGNNIQPGTAIATFNIHGDYANNHAAIFIEELEEGLRVWDQYNKPPKPWGPRLLPFKGELNFDRSNNGDLFHTIHKK